MSGTSARRRRGKGGKSASHGRAESPVRRRSPAAGDPAGTAAATPPRIVILSLRRAQAYEPRGREVCISITDPNAALARVSPSFRDVLRVSFTDIIEPTGLDSHVLFTPEHAAKILDFIDRCSDVEAIVIHCVGGLSRSPAVGMALCELHGWPLGTMEADYPIWNKWVRSQLVQRGRDRQLRNNPIVGHDK